MQGDLYGLKELPFVTSIPDDGRKIPIAPFFDEKPKQFRIFAHYNDKYMEMATGGRDILKGIYWSKNLANPKKDLYMNLVNLLYNNFSFIDPKGKKRGILDRTDSIVQDIHNFGAVIHKQFIIWDYIKSSNKPPSKSHAYDIYATEVEYLMGLVRSFFDLLYNIFTLLSEISEPKMTTINLKKINTLGKLSDKIIKDINDKNLSQSEVLKSYNFSDSFVAFFDAILPLFRLSRRIRDAIYHGGKSPGIIFITENGPGIGMQKLDPFFRDPFSSFKDFFKHDENFTRNLLENDIVSLFYFTNAIIGYSLDYAELFSFAILRFYKEVPENISNKHKIFIKGPEVKYINKIPDYLRDAWLVPLNKSFFKSESWNLFK
ncbi:hypothetical protein [Methanobacterium sp.]|uniref:hypothetical protein n=1 Tax=Methanobacterium sp. TaxID=2164 RepID=UPI003C70FEAB